MSKPQAIILDCLAFMLGLLLGALWHKLWIFPFPQLSQLRGNYRANFHFPSGERGYYTSDSIAGHIDKPFATPLYLWQEHPKGAIRLAVNNLGFREDSDTKRQKDLETYRILVTGDSHMDGVVYNSESFANRKEHGHS